MDSNTDFSKVATNVRVRVLKVAKGANKGHLGSALSICEIVVACFVCAEALGTKIETRTRLILSKGHAALAMYAAQTEFGIISEASLQSYCTNGSSYGTHPDASQVGTDFMTGSLGQGIGFGVGSAMASKIRNDAFKTFVILSDSELNEGSTWEALFVAGHHELKTLVVILDLNGQQAMGKTSDILSFDGFPESLKKSGWNVVNLDGHSVSDLIRAIGRELDDQTKPLLIVAKTTAGKGVSFMEGKVAWHYLPQTDEQHRLAMLELQQSTDYGS